MMMFTNVQLLADIGNTRIHIHDGNKVVHLSHEDAIEQYKNKKLKYITVKHQLKERLKAFENWEDISELMRIENEYETMGIDRKAICLSHENGIFVSAGSAITVDVVEQGKYVGGFLLPGLKAYIDAYATISPALATQLNYDISLKALPQTTRDAISFGIIASIKLLIEKYQSDKKLYISGGDGEFLSTFFDNAEFDETLIFQGMKNALEKV
ncbi:MAG: Pantothenate kinase type III, CoaX-like (EC [uncultured Sulfurovum sp.]|uniref:Type III pantothenate kinase n=1 Tax=uncultured Sulfurovum sp. TaxID=269237 RepID=A0A6S6SRE1_9BACT|nr:MAG: Pantothenate kinase type III, CoaX-like (EC [uncultured Sulfurovum sp.]